MKLQKEAEEKKKRDKGEVAAEQRTDTEER